MLDFTDHIIYKLIILIIAMPGSGFILSYNHIAGSILIALQIPKIITWVIE